MNLNQKVLIAIAPAVSLTLSACGMVERQPAADLKLAPGNYEVEAKAGPNGKWHDYMIVGESSAEQFLKSVLPNFQSRMQPSNGESSWQASDRPCSTEDFKADGGTFTAVGTCKILSAGKTTSFKYSGKSFGDSFEIKVEISGFGTKAPGVPDTVTIKGNRD